jgi:hypothetical protein
MHEMRGVVIGGLGVAVIIAAVGWTALHQNGAQLVLPAHTEFRVDKDSPKIKALMLEAVKGSPQAAADLAEMYGHCHKSGLTGSALNACFASSSYWTNIAVENGSYVGIGYRIGDLITTKRCIDAYRAEFWYNKLIAMRPDRKPVDGLLEDIRAAEQNCS